VLLREQRLVSKNLTYPKERAVSGDGPDVRWECSFPTMMDFEADMAARAKSPEFGNQRKQMGELLERFERHVQQSDGC
jgi:hypothetical protein